MNHASTTPRRARARATVALALAALALSSLALPAFAVSPPGPLGALDLLCAEYWDGEMRASPTWATNLGDHRFDDRLPDNSPAGDAADQARITSVLARARAIDPAGLDAERRVTRELLIEETESALARRNCHFEDWLVDPQNGPQAGLLNLPDELVVRTGEDLDAFVVRCRAMGPYMDQHVANLERGLAANRVTSIGPLMKTVPQLIHLARLEPGAWPLLGAVRRPRSAGVSVADSLRAETALRAAVSEVVKPAFMRYLEFLRARALPRARPQERSGLSELPGGVECYRKLIRVHTSLDKSPEELHALGLSEVARIRGELSALGARVLQTSDVAAIQKALRDDPAMHFTTAEEVEAKAREALARAQAAVPQWFHIQPRAACEVLAIGMHEAPQSTIAYYQQPSADGLRPGHYMINTYAPTTRPRYEAEALAYHEAVPGHHLQIAIAQELSGLPDFRKFTGTTAFVEGWGLYSERLAAEMGLYTSTLDSIGILSFDAWRACRLVVDTGIHTMGWSRRQAIDYMVENTVLAPNNIENEVDRYITRPGQALAYKVGQLEILRLRADAKARLGERFDIKGFHDAVLGHGAVSLPVLGEQVEAWVEARQANTP